MRLWIEYASRTTGRLEGSPEPPRVAEQGAALCTLRTEHGLVAGMAEGVGGEPLRRAVTDLAGGALLEDAIDTLLASLPRGVHAPVAILQVGSAAGATGAGELPAQLVEIEAPPLFIVRAGALAFLPVIEEEVGNRLVRRGAFTIQDGDHLALVSERYIRARGGVRPWSWRDIALSVRRLTATRCAADELADALMRSYLRWTGSEGAVPPQGRSDTTVLAMFARPRRVVTVWSGPPADPALDGVVLRRFLASEGTKVICGDTTAAVGARLLGGELVTQPPPEEGWTEVPPTSRLILQDGSEPVALVTEGAVTLGVALRRLSETRRSAVRAHTLAPHCVRRSAGAQVRPYGRSQDLLGRNDGASRLARLLIDGDEITFLEGLAVNPAQTTDSGTTWRSGRIALLARELQARGKIVRVETI